MKYLDALKKLKRAPLATDETDESPLLSVLSVPSEPLSENQAPLTREEQEELRALIVATTNPGERRELWPVALQAGRHGLEVYREIAATNDWIDRHERPPPFGGLTPTHPRNEKPQR